ncbi:M14 family metallocarboxypeptidase [Psychrobium sp. 1_MG-2023]|uniref:M14 family metallopeptidase n=1 Tax=Psychrobium sp. 1_MG-2023 TaxID=3062624 RepID=UPI000C34A470|nr:M14 family metallocarboxypeptidase [Psychrobium sp. 1_MG-2023]MDP2560120.1 M14 family metallocarboxypeptidase [Psychrobium sp. 1_MG-2023]PKF56933.1 peptidase [Alteromonadales bacterium alter-6D02]
MAAYPIGTPGEVWGETEKQTWLAQQHIKRSYLEQVVSKITTLNDSLDVEQYGALSYDEAKYPLFVIKTKHWDSAKPVALVTGGVHGYETSGVHGAIAFAATKAAAYSNDFNVIVAPCVSPWSYETINRWNPDAIDPNRSFYQDSPAQESAKLMAYVASLNVDITVHVDLHETTDTDNSEFRPALAARDGVTNVNWNIPDGFYLVGDTIKPQPAFQTAIIKEVEQVTHIAPADDEGKLIGVPLEQEGVINYATVELGLCAGFSNSEFCTTTEVYPDSPLVDDENCVNAQVAAIVGALDYVKTALST